MRSCAKRGSSAGMLVHDTVPRICGSVSAAPRRPMIRTSVNASAGLSPCQLASMRPMLTGAFSAALAIDSMRGRIALMSGSSQ